MSVSDIARFRDDFGAMCFETVSTSALRETLRRDDIAAVIVEPLVQAAAGMRCVSPAVYEPLRGRGETLLIVDEIATGFGRTGSLFAFEQLGLRPDLVCLGKGLTGGTLALSATLATARIYDAFLGAARDERHFYHGHSYAANPIACAAALASLDLFDTEQTLAHVRTLCASLAPQLERLRAHPAIADVRGAGLMLGIELAPTQSSHSNGRSAAWRVADTLYERGHFTRPIGNTLQLVPPLCSRDVQLADFVDTLVAALPLEPDA